MERNRKWRREAARCDLYSASFSEVGEKREVYLPVHTFGLCSRSASQLLFNTTKILLHFVRASAAERHKRNICLS